MTGFRTRTRVGSVDLHVCTFDEAVNALVGSGTTPVGSVKLVNSWCVVVSEDDAAYRSVVNGPGLTLPDGAPVVRAMRRDRTARHAERVRGPSLFEATLSGGREHALQHFFLGGAPETLEKVVKEVKRRYPGVAVAGAWSPPFGPADESLVDEAVARVQRAKSDIVWIGLGAPKQDIVAAELHGRTGLTTVGVGAAFDFVAGTVREAPRWLQRLGLEWLFRLIMEPRRLWRRYLVGNVQFLRIVSRR